MPIRRYTKRAAQFPFFRMLREKAYACRTCHAFSPQGSRHLHTNGRRQLFDVIVTHPVFHLLEGFSGLQLVQRRLTWDIPLGDEHQWQLLFRHARSCSRIPAFQVFLCWWLRRGEGFCDEHQENILAGHRAWKDRTG